MLCEVGSQVHPPTSLFISILIQSTNILEQRDLKGCNSQLLLDVSQLYNSWLTPQRTIDWRTSWQQRAKAAAVAESACPRRLCDPVILNAFMRTLRLSTIYRNGKGLYPVSASLLSFGVKSFLASSTIGTIPMNTAATVASIPILGLVKTAPHTETLSAEQPSLLTILVGL